MENKTNTKEDSINDIISGYTRYWFYFLISILLSGVLAAMFLRYANPIYSSSSTIIIKDEKSGGGAAELAALTDLSFFSNFSSSKIDSELTILESKTLIAAAVESLGLNVSYFNQGTFKTTELYQYKPFVVKFSNVSKTQVVPQLEIKIQKNQRFSLLVVDTETTIENAQFGEIYSLPFADIVLLPNQSNASLLESFIEKNILVEYKTVESVASLFSLANLDLIHDGKNGEVVQLNLSSPKPLKAENFLNELVYQYNLDARKDKSQIAKKTAEFIDSRLEIITKELDTVERNKELFKTNNRLTDIDTEAALVLENSNEFSKRQVDLLANIEVVTSYLTYVQNTSPFELLPTIIGTDSQNISVGITSFNALITERQKLLASSTISNPVVKNLELQIKDLKKTILRDIDNQIQSISSALSGLKNREEGLNNRLSKVPYQEKMFREILRQQNIKEELYLFLLKQREETAITLAVTSNKAKVVDSASTLKIPVFPNRLFVYLLAIILGIAVPFLIISLYNLLSTRIQSRKDVERVHATTAVVGEIPKLGRSDNELVKQNDNSILAESFRILRTNLQYLLVKGEKSNKHKKVIVTSTIKGEGKTFVAFNLALTLALTGKKVVLVGADIRNPQLQRYLPSSFKNNSGFTEYIIDESVKVSDITLQSEYNSNLSIVLSGAIPPNPAELLLQPRVDEFFNEIEGSFDYIIIDTAPSMLVTDTLLLNKHADTTVYVVRANYTDKKLLEFSYDAIQTKKLQNVALVINDVTMSNFGYGNKYGYTYTATKKTFWQKLFQG